MIQSLLLLSPTWFSGKDSACQSRRHRRPRFNPWAGRIPLEKEMVTHSRILARKVHIQRSLAGYSPRGHKESEGTEHTHC